MTGQICICLWLLSLPLRIPAAGMIQYKRLPLTVIVDVARDCNYWW